MIVLLLFHSVLQQKSQSVQLKEMEEQLTTKQHEVMQHQLHLQELEEQLLGSQDHGVGLQRKVDEYCSSVEKLEQELAITKQKHQIAVQEVCISNSLWAVCSLCLGPFHHFFSRYS